MKRFSQWLVLVMSVCMLLCVAVNAEANSVDDFTWDEDGNGGIIISSCSASGDIEIPAQIEGADVVAIGEAAFVGVDVTSVFFPNTVVAIGDMAFYTCTGLTEVVLPDNLTTIGMMAFSECSELVSVTIPYLVSEIADDAFDNCSEELTIYGYTGSYAEVYAGNNGFSFESIGDSPSTERFSGSCGDNLTWTIDNVNTLTVTGTGAMKNTDTFWWDYVDIIQNVVIEEGVTSIVAKAFQNSTSVESVSFPSTLVSIGDKAFYNCTALKIVSLPDTSALEKIGSESFKRCSAVTAFDFPSGLKEIGMSCFEMCSGITKAILPEGLTNIGAYAFYECTALEEVYVPSTVEVLNNYTFSRCLALTKITLNPGLKTINQTVFTQCPFTEITLPEGLEVISGYAFQHCGELKSLVIPSTVKSIGTSAFHYCRKLESVNIPSGITKIEDSTFENCNVLSSIRIPSGVTEIGDRAFYNCNLVDSVEFGDYLMIIGDNAFYGTAITSVTIPAGVGKIGYSAFPNSKMEKIVGYDDSAAQAYSEDNDITFESLGEIPDYVLGEGKCGDNLSWTFTTRGILTITGEGKAYDYSYSGAPWYELTVKKVVLNEGITYIGKYMFNESDIEEVVIPATVEKIGQSAFYCCENLKSVTLNEGLVRIMDCAFSECYRLDTIEIPSTTVCIVYDDDGGSAFDSAYLETVKGYNGTAAEAFAESAEIEFVSLGETEEKVILEEDLDGSASYTLTNKGTLNISSTSESGVYYDGPWYNLNMIKEIVIGDKITALGSGVSYVFHNLKYLESITISPYVTKIDQYAIYNDDGVYNFTIKGYNGTAAQACAERLGVEFVSLGDAPVIPVASGECGASATWTLDTAGVLTISGTGKIYDYVNPWDNNYRNDIKKIVVEKGINNIPYRAFEYEYFANEIEISYSVLSIEYLPNNITTIRGYNNTAAHKYATDNGMTFISLGDAPDEPVASGTAGANATWTLSASGVLTLSGSGEIRNDYGNSPYKTYSDAIRKAVVENGIDTIGYNAFYYYTALEEVVLPESLTTINSNAFANCEKLESIKLPDSITTIYAFAFGNCTSLTEVKLPLNLTSVSQEIFRDCSSLKSVTIQHNVYHIGSSAFGGCALESVIIPASVTSIYSGAFDSNVTIYGYDETYAQTYAKNNYMTFVSLGRAPLYEEVSGTVANLEWTISTDGIMTVTGTGAMEMENIYDDFPWADYVKYVDELVIGEGVTTVGNSALYKAEYLKKVTLPDSITAIYDSAFCDCISLERINLPENLEMVGIYTFYNTAITRLIVPETVSMFDEVFGYEYSDALVICGYTGSAAHRYAEQIGISFISLGVLEKKVVNEGKCGENLTWTIDNYGTLTIEGSGDMYDYTEESAPWHDEYYTTLVIKNGVTSIGDYAFANSSDLTKADLPTSIKVIGECAFYNSRIAPLALPEGVVEIGDKAFFMGPINVIVPESVTTIADTAFLYDSYSWNGNEYKTYCNIYCVSDGKIQNYCIKNRLNFTASAASGTCGDTINWDFDMATGVLNIKGTGAMYDYVDSYAPWESYSQFVKNVNISEGITTIGADALQGFGGITELKLPSGVKEIKSGAIGNCWNLSTVIIPEGCETIGENAFFYCPKIKQITIPESVTSIADTVFSECDSMTVCGASDSEAQRIAELYEYDFVDIYATPVISEVTVTNIGEFIEITVNGTALENKLNYVVSYGANGAMMNITKAVSGVAMLRSEDVAKINVMSFADKYSIRPVCENVIVEKIDFVTEEE